MAMANRLFQASIDLKKHSSVIYAEGVFGLDARKKLPMRAKTADGVLRYAEYKIAGVIDSTVKIPTPLSPFVSPRRKPEDRGEFGSKASDILPIYLRNSKNSETLIFPTLKEAKSKTNADVLILGSAPEGGELPNAWKKDIAFAIKNKMHIVSGLHYALNEDRNFQSLAKKNKVIIWDTRRVSGEDLENIPMGSARAYHVKKPIVLTVGTDAAIGKMTVSYEMNKAAKKLGLKSCVIPTGQTAIMIEGWGAAIDALPADFMAGAVEQMVLEKAKRYDMLFVEGQGSLFHPAYANTMISLIHGAVPTHLVLAHRPQRKHSVGSRLVKLPSVKTAIAQYENAILPAYRNAKVIAVALNTDGGSYSEITQWKQEIENECNLPVFDAVKDEKDVRALVRSIAKTTKPIL